MALGDHKDSSVGNNNDSDNLDNGPKRMCAGNRIPFVTSLCGWGDEAQLVQFDKQEGWIALDCS